MEATRHGVPSRHRRHRDEARDGENRADESRSADGIRSTDAARRPGAEAPGRPRRGERRADGATAAAAGRPGPAADSGRAAGEDASTSRGGLEGVVAAQTRLSSVDGEAGELLLAGHRVDEIAPRAEPEEMAFLLWNDRLPDAEELAALRRRLATARALPPAVLDLLRGAAAAGAAPMAALRMAVAALDLEPVAGAGDDTGDDAEDGPERDAVRLMAAVPAAVAAHHRLSRGLEPVPPEPSLGHAAAFLHQLEGRPPSPARARALATYLNTVVDHGLNASTFTARVIVSTGADLVSAVAGAVGALAGPLHGGAPGPALDTVFEIGREERAEEVLRSKLAAGERLMGFGHRVYRVRDPRADVLAAAAETLFEEGGGDRRLYALARHVEATALRLLREHKPERRLDTNVEFYTALLLHGLGLPVPLFTPVFAAGRVAGWTAHALEQLRDGRLIRPASAYRGARGRRWVPISERG